MAKSILIIVALLASPAAAVAPKRPRGHLSHRTMSTMPMVMFEEDCKLNSTMNQALKSMKLLNSTLNFALKAANPGAGLEAFTPFDKVLKDGFYLVDCVKDSLREFGDKFGNGKQAYNMGDIANVSIIHYTEVVPKEDQKPMSHEVCFSFCRTVPDMLFFGIHNGRDCYCAPYYDAMESDSTECDAVCEGSPATMCGGKVKSSMFGMHSCSNKGQKLSQLAGSAAEVLAPLLEDLQEVEEVAEEMQGTADMWQKKAGQGGDPAASDLMQSAKAFAGELEKFAKAHTKIHAALDAAATAAQGTFDWASSADAEKGDAAAKALVETLARAEDAAQATTEILKVAAPWSEQATGAAGTYRPLMYFAGDKNATTIPTTCNGDAVNKPMAMLSEDECAKVCDDNFRTCVAYAYYPGELCFMFSKLKTATAYTGCTQPQQQQQQQQFLQKNDAKGKAVPMCKLKLSKYDGTNISPESDRAKSGRCPNCLKELTMAARCI